MVEKIVNNTIFRLIAGIILGLVLGNYLNEKLVQAVLSVKHILGQIIYFLIPLIVVGVVAASITKLSDNSSKIFGFALLLAYFASVAAEFFVVFGLSNHSEINHFKRNRKPERNSRTDF